MRGAPSPARLLAASTGVASACVLPSFLVGAMAVQVRADLGFSEAGIGVAFGTFFGVASLGSAAFGRTIERWGPVPALRAAGALSAAACLAVAGAAGSFTTLVLLLGAAGLANAVAQPAANLLLAKGMPPGRLGVAFAVKQSAIPFATLLSGGAVSLAIAVGWRWGFGVAAGLNVLAVAAVPAGVERPERGLAVDRSGDVPVGILALLALGIGLGAAAAGSLGSFLVSAAVDAGVSEGGAGLLLMAGSAAGIATRVTVGLRADRRDGGHLRVVSMLLVSGAAVFALLAVHEPGLYVVAGPLGFCTAWAFPGLFNFAVVRANPARPAAATGITQTGTYIGAVSGPLLFGVLAERAGFPTAWLVAAVLSALAAAAIVAGRSRLRAWRDGAEVVVSS